MPEKKLSRKTRKMLALFEAEVAEAKARVIVEAKAFADDDAEAPARMLVIAVADLRKTEALLAAAVEVAHA